MTRLSLAARNRLAQDASLRALLGRSVSWSTWIFDENPVGVHVENTSRCLIVVSEDDEWTSPNPHNTMRFPQLLVDIWADPTRNPDRSVQRFDAKDKIEEIQALVDKHFHLPDPGTRFGVPHIWGTAEQEATKTGLVIAGSERRSTQTSPISDSEGSWMRRITYAVNVP